MDGGGKKKQISDEEQNGMSGGEIAFYVVCTIILIFLFVVYPFIAYSYCFWPSETASLSCRCTGTTGKWDSTTSKCICNNAYLNVDRCACPIDATKNIDGSCKCPDGKVLSPDFKTCIIPVTPVLPPAPTPTPTPTPNPAPTPNPPQTPLAPPTPPQTITIHTTPAPVTFYGTNQGRWNSPNVSQLLCNVDSNDYIKEISGFTQPIPGGGGTEMNTLAVKCSSGINPPVLNSVLPSNATYFDVSCSDGFTELDVRAGWGLVKIDPWCDGTASSNVTMSTADGGTLSNFQCPSGQKLRGISTHHANGTYFGDVAFICN